MADAQTPGRPPFIANAEGDWGTAVLLRERVRRGGSFYIGSLEHRPDCRFRVERGYVDVPTHVRLGRHDLARVESVSPGTISGFAQKLASPALVDRATVVEVSRKTSLGYWAYAHEATFDALGCTA